MTDYDSLSLLHGIRTLGINEGDTVLCHISLGRLGRMKDAENLKNTCRLFFDAWFTVLGKSGNLFIPTYTYSIGRNEIFDLQSSVSNVGEATNYFRNLPGTVRSREPMLSVAGRGPLADSMLNQLPPTSFGKDSFYDRLRGADGKIITVGIGLHWATFRHHIEECAQVPFRFLKTFQGAIRDQGQVAKINWNYYAAYQIENCEPNGRPLEEMARKNGISHSVPMGRSEIHCINAKDYFDLGFAALKKEPWLTARGPALTEKELVKAQK